MGPNSSQLSFSNEKPGPKRNSHLESLYMYNLKAESMMELCQNGWTTFGFLGPVHYSVGDPYWSGTSFVHISLTQVKNLLSQRGTWQAVIPGGCTSMLQLLDVSLNKPFKSHVRKYWKEWMINGPRETTQKGNLKAPFSVYSLWVGREVLERDSSRDVCKVVSKCGTDNDILYEDFSSEKCEAESCESDGSFVYGDGLSDEQISELFRSDDEERDFEGF